MWKYTFVIPIQVAKVYLCLFCQFFIIRIVRMVCDRVPDVREPDGNGKNHHYNRRKDKTNQFFVCKVVR